MSPPTSPRMFRCQRSSRPTCPEASSLPESNLVLFGSRDLFDEAEVSVGRPQRQKVEGLGVPVGLPRSGGRRLRGPRRAWHRPVPGAEGNSAGRRQSGCRVHGPGVRRRRATVCSADAARSGAEVSLVGRREAGAEPAGHAAVAEDQGAREEGHEGHGRRAAEALRSAQDAPRAMPLPPTANGSASSKTPSSSTRPKTR